MILRFFRLQMTLALVKELGLKINEVFQIYGLYQIVVLELIDEAECTLIDSYEIAVSPTLIRLKME